MKSLWQTENSMTVDVWGEQQGGSPNVFFFVPKFKHTQFLMTEQMISQEITIALITSTYSEWCVTKDQQV